MEDKIAACKLFQNVSIEEVNQLLSQIKYVKKSYSKDSIIVFQNDVCVNLIIMYTGKAIAEKINYSGKTIVVEEFIAPRIFAPAFIFIKDNRYPVSVYALETCEVILIPRNEFMNILQQHQQILFNFLQIISEQTYFLNNKLNVSKLSLKGKIANYMLNQVKNTKKEVFTMISHQRLADLFGVARPSFTRTLAEMQKDKTIVMDVKEVRILNMQVLRNLAE